LHYCCCTAKTDCLTRKTTFYISYQVAEMAFLLIIMTTVVIFCTGISCILAGLNLAHASSHKLFEA